MSEGYFERRGSIPKPSTLAGVNLSIVRHLSIETDSSKENHAESTESIMKGDGENNGNHSFVKIKEGDGGENHVKRFCRIPMNRRFKIVIYSFTYFWAGVAYSLPAPFYPNVAIQKGISLPLVGLVFSVYQLVIFITCPFFGAYLTTIGPRFAFTSGITVAGICSILFGTLNMCPPGTPFIVLSILVRSVAAVGFSSFYTAIMSAGSAEYPDNIATAWSIIEGAFGVGLMIGPSIGGVLYSTSGFGTPFYVLGSFVIVVGAFTYFIMPTSNIDNQTHASGTFVSLFRSPLILVGVLSTIVGCIGISFLEPILAKHLEPFGLSVIIISLFFIIMPSSYTLIAPFWGYLSDTKGVFKELIVIGQFLLGLGFLFTGPSNVLPFLPNKLLTVTVGLFMIGVTFGCTIVPTFKCILSGAMDVGYTENMSTYAVVAGVAGSAYSLGAFVGPMLGGILVQELGDRSAFTVVGLLNMGMSVTSLMVFTLRRWKRKKNCKNNSTIGDSKITVKCNERTRLISK